MRAGLAATAGRDRGVHSGLLDHSNAKRRAVRTLARAASRFLVACLALGLTACASAPEPTLSFWYADVAFAPLADAAARLGAPLTAEEIRSIERISETELERAFSGLGVRISQRREGFWRVAVLQTLPTVRRLPSAGQSVALGPFGGAGSVAFGILASTAIQYAPAGASRQVMIEGIGRGIGRAAVHEFAHQILGPAMRDDRDDQNGYEYHSSARASQYYGELHWTMAWPLLQQRIRYRNGR
jgi:hypothetical protein